MRVKVYWSANDLEKLRELDSRMKPFDYRVGLEDGKKEKRREPKQDDIEKGIFFEKCRIITFMAFKGKSAEEIAELTAIPIALIRKVLTPQS